MALCWHSGPICRTGKLRGNFRIDGPAAWKTSRELLPFNLYWNTPPLPEPFVGYFGRAAGGYHRAPMPGIHITDVEAAINHWRQRSPSPDGVTLAPELRALAEVYALLIYHREDEADEASFPAAAHAAWLAWYSTTPDTPCIAICSTSQGDDVCKGCGRTFDEVQHWPEMTPASKRATWRRITLHADAWRFNRYSERAAEK